MTSTITRTLAGLGVAALLATGLTACSGNVTQLAVGDCFNDPDDLTEVTDVEMVDCSEPHDNEVYADLELPEGDFPGETAVLEEAQVFCLAEFEKFIGLPYDESAEIDVYVLYPMAETWKAGDRNITCAVYDLTGQATGTLKGAAR